jgi:hypothetical protein
MPMYLKYTLALQISCKTLNFLQDVVDSVFKLLGVFYVTGEGGTIFKGFCDFTLGLHTNLKALEYKDQLLISIDIAKETNRSFYFNRAVSTILKCINPTQIDPHEALDMYIFSNSIQECDITDTSLKVAMLVIHGYLTQGFSK